MISFKSLVLNIWETEGWDSAWDSFEDLVRALTFPRNMHTFTDKLHEIPRPKSQGKGSLK